MKKNNIIGIGSVLAITMMIMIGACKKENKVPSSQLLVKNWQQTDLLASVGGSAYSSVFTTVLEACDRDDIWQFKADGTYSVAEGATKCNPSDPEIATTGTWQLIENDSKLIIDDISDVPQTFTITELTSTSLKLTGTETIQGNAVTAIAIFEVK
jgi:Lipocalin-like domain